MEMPLWQAVLVGVIVVLILLLFRPGIKTALEQSRQAEKDWKAVLIPIGVAVLFVVLVILLAMAG